MTVAQDDRSAGIAPSFTAIATVVVLSVLVGYGLSKLYLHLEDLSLPIPADCEQWTAFKPDDRRFEFDGLAFCKKVQSITLGWSAMKRPSGLYHCRRMTCERPE